MATQIISRTDANALINPDVTKEIIQGTIERSAVLSMGHKLRNMTSKEMTIPVLENLPTAYFVNNDTGFKQTSNMSWAKKRIHAEEVAVIIPIPEAVLDDADYDLWGEIKPRVVEAFGKKIDGAVLFGYDKPNTWRNDVFTSATAKNAVVTATSNMYQDIFGVGGVFAKVEESGYDVDGIMAGVSTKAKLRGLVDTTGRPLFTADLHTANTYTLDGTAMTFPKNGAFDQAKALMIAGDFDKLVYSIRQDMTYKVLTEATIVDPETHEVIYSLAQQDMVALRCVMRLGWELLEPVSAFNEGNVNAFPFAVYAPGA